MRIAGIVIFTVIEVITLVLWLVLAGVPFHGHGLAVIILLVGLFVEHYVSVNVGQGRPPFSLIR